MRVEYELKEEDFLAFQLYFVKHSKTVQRSLILQRFLIPILFILVSFFISYSTHSPLLSLFLVYFIAAVLWIILWPNYFYGIIRRRTKKMLREGKHTNLLGKCVVTVTEKEIIEESPTERSSVRLALIDKVEENDDYIIIFLNAIKACMIPKRSFPDEQSEKDFIVRLKELLLKAK
ncbi:YcxB family protein [Ectobacillus polymachus]|uniref:YcxB family protein n=1 Tax=Ectobacillus polymachus TaxID=1508806 RepID=UPI003A898E96